MSYPASASFPAVASFNLNVFLWDGDSMNLGTTVGSSHAMHTLMAAEANFSGKGRFENVAVGGTSVAQQIAAFDKTKPFRTKPGHGFLFLWAGTAALDANTFTDLQTYWAMARADGWKVIAHTLQPKAGESAPTIALREGVNASIAAATSEWDYLFDTASWFTDPTDPTFFSDGTHMTAAGYQAVADLLNDNLNLPVL